MQKGRVGDSYIHRKYAFNQTKIQVAFDLRSSIISNNWSQHCLSSPSACPVFSLLASPLFKIFSTPRGLWHSTFSAGWRQGSVLVRWTSGSADLGLMTLAATGSWALYAYFYPLPPDPFSHFSYPLLSVTKIKSVFESNYMWPSALSLKPFVWI